MREIDKVRVILPHWIAHNREHGAEFVRWAEALDKDGHVEVSDALRKAVAAIEEVTARLEQALEFAGGGMESALSGHSHGLGHDHGHDHGHAHGSNHHHHNHHDGHGGHHEH